MKKSIIMIIICIGLILIYWIGADLLGLWLPCKFPWKTYEAEYPCPVLVLDGSQEEIATELVTAWLDQYKSGNTEPMSRLRDYEIVAVSEVQPTEGGFMCFVEFNVQPYGRLPKEVDLGMTLKELKTYWISGNGIIEDRLIKGKVIHIVVSKE